jgi:hypothetical protein
VGVACDLQTPEIWGWKMRIFSIAVLFGAGAVGLLASSLRADVSLYDSGGFDLDTRFSPTFVNGAEPNVEGNLRGQDGGAWFYRGTNTSTSTVAFAQVITTAEGPNLSPQQSVQVTRTSGDGEWAPILNYNATGMTVKVTWAMDLAAFSTPSTNFGPFFGIDSYTGPLTRLGGAGIDATTGEFLFEDPTVNGGFNINGPDTVVGLGWHNWEIDYNFATQTYSASVDGTTEVSSVAFLTPSATVFNDADIATLQAVSVDANNAGTAYFDNYAVSAVPEPTSFGVALLGGLGCLLRRRK